MSDFDRNVAAARGGYADRATAIDAGLRAYMIRVYNYMAAAVALTGVVAWFTFNAAVTTDAAGAIVGMTAFGQAIFSGPALIVLCWRRSASCSSSASASRSCRFRPR